MTLPQDFVIDRKRARQRFAASVATADTANFLAREVSRRMQERLDYIRIAPTRILDLGCGTGADLAPLAQRYPQATRLTVDFARPLVQRAQPARGFMQKLFGAHPQTHALCADAEALPLARSCVQMVWSNLMLNWLHDPMPALQEAQRVLEVGGMLMFSTLGPDTLKELRACLPTDQGERVHRFIDMHDLGDCLLQAGFAEPVMDMEVITLTYDDLDALFADLRNAGSNNASAARPRVLSGKAGWQAARARYESLRHDKRLPATFEIIYGHAWKAAPKQIEDGRAIVRFMERKT